MRVEFEADTLEELVAMARRWAAKEAGGAETQSGKPEQLEDVLLRIRSPSSLHFLREVAARSLEGSALALDAAFRERLGLPAEGALVGVVGVANRTMRRRAGRDLVYSDKQGHGYRMSNKDAQAVIATLGPPAR